MPTYIITTIEKCSVERLVTYRLESKEILSDLEVSEQFYQDKAVLLGYEDKNSFIRNKEIIKIEEIGKLI